MEKLDYILLGHALQPVLSPVEAGQAITTRYPEKIGMSSNTPFYPSCNL
jgi:hypothetical protein